MNTRKYLKFVDDCIQDCAWAEPHYIEEIAEYICQQSVKVSALLIMERLVKLEKKRCLRVRREHGHEGAWLVTKPLD